MKTIHCLMGPPGAGKGTTAPQLAARLGAVHVSTGDWFRGERALGTTQGMMFASYQDGGVLVPDQLADPFIFGHLESMTAEVILLDGYPRTLAQAHTLDNWIKSNGHSWGNIWAVDCPDDEIIRRLASRLICKVCFAGFNAVHKPPKVEGVCDRCGGEVGRRPDDEPDRVRARLQDYHTLTAPILLHFDRGIGVPGPWS